MAATVDERSTSAECQAHIAAAGIPSCLVIVRIGGARLREDERFRRSAEEPDQPSS